MRCRVSGESARFDDSITILSRDLTSATEITSSLTTAAILVSVISPGGGCATGPCCPGAAVADPRGEGARAAMAGLERLSKPASRIENQRTTVIDRDLPLFCPRPCSLHPVDRDVPSGLRARAYSPEIEAT